MQFVTLFHDDYEKKTGRPWMNAIRKPLNEYFPDPVKVGHVQTIDVMPGHYTLEKPRLENSTSRVSLKTVATSPRLFFIEDFLSSDEADHFVELMKNRTLQQGALKDGSVVSDTRTAQITWISCDKDDIVKGVATRSFNLLRKEFNESWGRVSEEFQMLKYMQSNEDQAHYGKFGEILRCIKIQFVQIISTLKSTPKTVTSMLVTIAMLYAYYLKHLASLMQHAANRLY
jgi:hypothetical protein